MLSTNSPLEHLAAFAIAFVAGVASTAALGAYVARLRKAAHAGTGTGQP